MKKFVLCVIVLFFGIVKPKAQDFSTTYRPFPNNDCYWKTGSLFSDQRPIEVIQFHGKIEKKKVTLEWTIAGNEQANLFEVEKSLNGKDFATAGLVFSSEKSGTEQYSFFEKKSSGKRVYYRLKLVDKSQSVDYSSILALHV